MIRDDTTVVAGDVRSGELAEAERLRGILERDPA